MYNLPASSLSLPKMSKLELENSRKFKAEQAKKAKNEEMAKLEKNIKICNEQINNEDFIRSADAENLKCLLTFRLNLISQFNELKQS